MKAVLLSIVICLSFSAVGFGQVKYGDWNKLNAYPGIECRVGYHRYDSAAARVKKPPHVWCLQIRNMNMKKVGISWNVADGGVKIFDNDTTWRRNPCIKSGETIEDCNWFTNTSPKNSVSVWMLNMKDCKAKKP